MSALDGLASKSRGVFLGAATGDALGWPQEQNSGIVGGNAAREVNPTARFRTWERSGGTRFARYVDPVRAGSYSDDTQLLLATARSVQHADWFTAMSQVELPLFVMYQRGGGGATLRACHSWASGRPPWHDGTTQKQHGIAKQYFTAGGNGVAMRIAPHAIVTAKRSVEELVARVVADGTMTHGHPRALVGAAAYATAIHALNTVDRTLEFGDLARLVLDEASWQTADVLFKDLPEGWMEAAEANNQDFRDAWQETVRELRSDLSFIETISRSGALGNDLEALERLGTFNRKINGAGTVTTAGAIYLASRNAPKPMSGLLRAAFLRKADTDTLASMTGALLGSIHGQQWLSEMLGDLQDAEYIAAQADTCTRMAFDEAHDGIGPVDKPVERSTLDNLLGKFVLGDSPETLPDNRKCLFVDDFDLEGSKSTRAHRWVVRAEGQTIIIDKVIRTGRTMEKPSGGSADSTSDVALSSLSTLDRVTVPVTDISAIEKFYRQLTSQIELWANGDVSIDNRIFFTSGRKANRGTITLTFNVRRIAEIATLLDVKLEGDATHFYLTDPNGNQVMVRQTV